MVRQAAGKAPLALVLEGGYDLGGLAHSVVSTLEALTGVEAGVAEPASAAPLREAPFAVASARARAVRRVAGDYWAL
jgi:acetoin utilization deacetylase AcuC-like enzyme